MRADATRNVTIPIPGLFRSTYVGAKTVSIPRFDPALGTLVSVTIEYSPEFSGTVSAFASGPANAPNGWVIECSGTVRFNAPGFSAINFPHFETRSGLVFQPGTHVFQVFGPQTLTAGFNTIFNNLTSYIGTGNLSASLTWPTFTAYVFWSNGGSSATVTRDLGATGGQVIYEYIPNPGDCHGQGLFDAFDFMEFPACLSGPGTQSDLECDCQNIDDDSDVDLFDFGLIQLNFVDD